MDTYSSIIRVVLIILNVEKTSLSFFFLLILPKSHLSSHLLLHSIQNNFISIIEFNPQISYLMSMLFSLFFCWRNWVSVTDLTVKEMRQKGNQRDLKSGKDSAYHLWLQRWTAPSLGRWAASRSWDQSLVKGWQGNGDLSRTTSGTWLLP